MVATDDTDALLASHPLVAPLNDEERAVLLDAVEARRARPEEVLIDVGDAPGPLLLVLDGTVAVERHGREIGLVGRGSWIGELSLIDERPARNRVTAVDDVLLGLVPATAARRALDLGAVALPLDSVAARRRAANRALEVQPVGVTTRDGRRALVRPLVASDWRAYVAGYDAGRVSERSLHMRFFTEPPRSERRFRELTDPDWRAAFAWTIVVHDELAAVGRYALQTEDRSVAEVAMLVADDHQGEGLGTLLVEALVVAADVHGVDELYAVAWADNAPVRRLLERFGARWSAAEERVVAARWPIATACAALPDDERIESLRRVAGTVLEPVLEL